MAIAGGRGNVDSDGALMGGSNNVVVAAVMVPLKSELIAGLDSNRLGDLTIVDIAIDRGSGDIFNGVVGRGRTNVDVAAYYSRLAFSTPEDLDEEEKSMLTIPLENIVNPDTINPGVSRSNGQQGGESNE